MKARLALALCLALEVLTGTSRAGSPVVFARDFAPAEGWTKPVEQPLRQDLCLNGLWQFQPIPLPDGWRRDTGIPPELPPPDPRHYDAVPIKIPSPWNVNTWGAGRRVGESTPHPYWPSSVYYPSYPAHWDGVQMGWLRRTFRVPPEWAGRRLVLHFEAVAGHAQIFVNGVQVGEHFGRYLPFEFDITSQVKPNTENELLVGVRSLRLYDQRSAPYKHMRTPYPPGSNTDQLCGIWQDVFLLGLPAARVQEVFVQPWVASNRIETEVTLRNDSPQPQILTVRGEVRPWINLAGTNLLAAPEPNWRLDAPVMELPAASITLNPGEARAITLSATVAGRLREWSPDAPNLYGLVLSVSASGQTVDRHYTRFGWRQFTMVGNEYHLNGRPLKMYGDLLHPFGPFVNSRRYVWAWYRMIKDMHGNAVRPHAQPHPRHYLDLADEMGLLVLDETALFGSSLQLNFAVPAAWDRFAAHYDGLVRRDRNHPSVFGWSPGNELFAIFIYDPAITKAQADTWYQQLAELALRARRLDPTRPWISCDGDEDLRGTLPVWNKHFGHGLPPPDALPQKLNKPLMIGESGGSYYARPGQLAVFNGERAFADYQGRNEALAIDLYENIVKVARPRLAFFSPAETAWFGLEHLHFGYRDFTRLPNATDGVWFKPFEEGKPGVQIERLPPYVCTLNPGWDPALPLYRPLAMFAAQQAAQHPAGPQPGPWDRRIAAKPSITATSPAPVDRVAFAGAADGELHRRLTALGMAFKESGTNAPQLLVVDGGTLAEAALAQTRSLAAATLDAQGTVLVMFRQPEQISPAVNRLLPATVTLTHRQATALQPRQPHHWTAGLGLPDLYFAEDPNDKLILKCGLAGDLPAQGRILLEASNTDWSQFNEVPENAKCAATVLYEQLIKPGGAALVEVPAGRGRWLISALEVAPTAKANADFWRRLMGNAGVRIGLPAMQWLVPPGWDGQPGALWRFTTNAPAADWSAVNFDDRDWPQARGSFGSPGIQNARSQTRWSTPAIWLRATFELGAVRPAGLVLAVYHDEDVEVFINGVPALRRPGHLTSYQTFPLPPEAARALQPGRNVLAVSCRQTAGEQYIDVGLGLPITTATNRQHNLLLDGPVNSP